MVFRCIFFGVRIWWYLAVYCTFGGVCTCTLHRLWCIGVRCEVLGVIVCRLVAVPSAVLYYW